jgi:prepilin-type N-terminal cleavage/methylation domain-containing protein
MKSYSKYLNDRGTSLIETMIVIAIIGIVVTSAVSMSLIGLRAYSAGNEQTNIQFEVRRAVNDIIDQVRDAKDLSNISFTSSSTIDIDEMIPSIYINTMKYSVTDDMLSLYIESTNGRESYAMSTEVLLNNYSSDIAETTGKFYILDPDSNDFATSFDTIKNNNAILKSFEFSTVPLNWTDFTSSTYLPSTYTFDIAAAYVPQIINVATDDANAIYTLVNAPFVGEYSEVAVTAEDGITVKTYKYKFNVISE